MSISSFTNTECLLILFHEHKRINVFEYRSTTTNIPYHHLPPLLLFCDFASGMGAKYCDQRYLYKFICLFICLFACLSVLRMSRKPQSEFYHFCMLPVAVVRSSYDGDAIHYVLPVCG